ncbi:MAG: acetamidase/formamidase family protein [Candidatus Hodarchaeota archaeon]
MTRLIKKLKSNELDLIRQGTLGPLNKPIEKVSPGEELVIETCDCYGDVLAQERPLDFIHKKKLPIYENPVTGPLYVVGAEPGDTLVVEILDIELPDIGTITIEPGCGALQPWLEKQPTITKFVKIQNGKIYYKTNHGKTIELTAKPFVGTIGVAPAVEAISTFTPERHGGNMDCEDVCVGSRLFLPVSVEGALFGLGDVHALQGDGEICGYGVEIPAKVKLKLDLQKSKSIGWPRIETPDTIATVCSSKPLEDAARLAYLELIKWLEEDYGFERYDAYMFLSIAARARIAQIVDPLYTVEAILPKKYLT